MAWLVYIKKKEIYKRGGGVEEDVFSALWETDFCRAVQGRHSGDNLPFKLIVKTLEKTFSDKLLKILQAFRHEK